nr:NUDIX domain-containing protein [uncultured Carboxylicivirga sp.]
MYKVFFNDRILFLTDSLEQDLINNYFDALHKFTSHHELKQFIESFENNKDLQQAFLYGRPKEQLLTELKKCFKFLMAAGGLVSNSNDDLLIIHRLGVYDLPKGKAEKDESIEETALREVTEECGIAPLHLENKLCSTFHTYIQKGTNYLKETVWFMMKFNGSENPVPQTEENIASAQWLSVTQLNKVKGNTYPSIIEVLDAAGY